MSGAAGGHDERERNAWAETVATVAACAVALLLFDAAFNLARGAAIPVGYWLLILAVSLVLALLVGGVAALLRRGWRPALAMWIALEGFAWSESAGWRRLLLTMALAALAWTLLGLRAWRGRRPWPAALGVTCGFGLATLIWPRLAAALPIDLDRGAGEELATAGVFGAVLLLLSLASIAVPRRWPGPGWLAVVGMMVTLIGVRFAYLGARPQTGDPPTATTEVAAGGELPSIIVLVLDTVRADILTIYDAAVDTTPHLRRFVEESDRAVVYPWAFAPSNWTIPSHASMFTGTLPSRHGAHEGAGGLQGSPFNAASLDAERTLAEALGARGYRTALLTANPTLLRVRGMERGFDLFRQPPPPRPSSLVAERLRRELLPSLLAGAVGETPKADRVAAELVEVLEAGPAPVFAVANFMEAHTPYTPPWSEAGRFTGRRLLSGPAEARVTDPAATVELARKRYLEEIRALDRQLGALLERLAAAGHLDDAWLVITSDHGEAFMEHGSTNHGGNVFNEQVRVPLIIQPPRDGRALAASMPVSLVDLATTLAAVAGVPGFGDGRDLTGGAGESPVVIEFFGNRRKVGRRYSPHAAEPAGAVVMRRLKLIRRSGREWLFDLAEDPAELVDRLADGHPELATLRAALPALEVDESIGEQPEPEASYDELEALRALGYLD